MSLFDKVRRKTSNIGGFDLSMAGLPLTRETETTYGGTKPGKAPTPKAPNSPDPFALINAQAAANRVNEIGPSGSTIYSRNDDGTWNQTRSFSPELQGIYDKQVELLQDPFATDSALEKAYYDRHTALMEPMFAKAESALEQKLANQGLPIGGEAYDTDFGGFYDSKNRAYSDIANQAVSAGRTSQQNMFNQMAALLGGQQTNAPMPLDTTTPFQMQQQGDWNNYQARANQASQQNQQTQAGVGAALSLISLFCSAEYKENGQAVNEDEVLNKLDFLNLEMWNYKGDNTKHIGPYAEDFQKLFGLGNGQEIAGVDAFGVLIAAVKSLSAKVRELENESLRD